MRSWPFVVTSVSLMIQASLLGGTQTSPDLPKELHKLLADYPKAAANVSGGRVISLYGAPMTGAQTPDQAAQWWLDEYAAAFGVPDVDLRLIRSNRVNPAEKFTVFVYRQFLEGLAVEEGMVRLVVLNGSPNRVVYAAARLANLPEGGFALDSITADQALASVQENEEYADLTEWSGPDLVILHDVGSEEMNHSRRTWKFTGVYPDLAAYRSFTFFVDAADGTLLYVRNEVHHTDIIGSVTGKGTPGLLPDVNYNLATTMDLEDLRVLVDGGSTAYTDALGDFVLPNDGDAQVIVEADMVGHWVSVFNDQGSELHSERTVTPPGPADFAFNVLPVQTSTSQVNAHIHTTRTHDFYKDRQPDFTGLDIVITANVNIASSCNAFFSGTSINFYNAAGSCPNTAYSTVVAHEYGHFIVDRQFLSQGAFGEGFADCVAILQYNDPVVGQDFFGQGTYVRNTVVADKQYPCFDAIHDCGQVLSGVWWDLKLNLEAEFGEEAGLEIARQLFTDWAELTNGGDGGDAAHPETAVEVLTADDDEDGYIGNGTPHRDAICDAFDQHGIDCPPLDAIAFAYPDGIPQLLAPDAPTLFRVTVVEVTGSAVPGTGTLSYRSGENDYITVAMIEVSPNEYEAVLPGTPCPGGYDFYVAAEAENVGVLTDPPTAPDKIFVAVAALGTADVQVLDFETEPGWTLSGTAVTGHWDRGLPTDDGRGDPSDDYDGSGQCYLTGRDQDEDIDDGSAILTSVTYDLSGLDDPHVSYARWFSNTFGNDPENDIFLIQVSDNAGASWVTLEIVGPSGDEVDGGWIVPSFRVADFVTPNEQFQIRFNASDLGDGSVVEAALDAFRIFTYLCADSGCPGDANGDGTVDPLDSGFVQSRLGCAVGAGDSACDASDQNTDGEVDPLDVGFVLSRFGECS